MLPLRLAHEARIAGDVAGDQEGAAAGAAQAALHRLGALGKAERDRGLVVDPRNRRAGDQPRLAQVLGADPHPLERIAIGKVVPLRTVMAMLTGPRFDTGDFDVALERARQRMVECGPAQRLREVENVGAVVAVEDDRAHRLAGHGVARGAGHVAGATLTGVLLSARLVAPIGWNARWMLSRPCP